MNQRLTCDPDLLRRYDQPGPRYTSYPTAPQFQPGFTEDMLREYVRRGNEAPTPRNLSIYVHVPYCSSPCLYCGCNRIITRDRTVGGRYVEHLTREISLAAPLFDRGREVVQVHFGGGTPNYLRADELQSVMDALRAQFQLSSAAIRDFSIEIDPRFLSVDDVAAYARMGLNRASLGVQDFDPTVQRAVNRVQSAELTLAAIDACRQHGFRSVNVDLIYGLPHQTLAGFSRTLDTVIDIRPDRLAVYGYAHMPHLFKAQRHIDSAALPNAEERIALLALAIEKLTAAGYVYIGMDHFALPEDDLVRAHDAGTLHRNFMGYTTHANCDLLGLGVSSISHIGDSFNQNYRDLPSWERAVDSGRLPVWRGRRLDDDDRLRGDVIQQLMCGGSIDIAAVERRHGIDFHQYFADALTRVVPLVDDGLVEVDPVRISATSRGRLLLRIVAMCFDRYLEQRPAQPQYSKAI